jgi:cytochrome c peroxidase
MRVVLIMAAVLTIAATVPAVNNDPKMTTFSNASGQLRTLNAKGALDLDNPFFQDLGTNGRRCVTCHQPDSAWTITPDNVQARFAASNGLDPIFMDNDGSNCEGAAAFSIADRQAAYSLLLSRGLIRVGLDVPPDAEFRIESVSDPNHCRQASNDVSAYRRPLPATNLRFLSAVMWDGRESTSTTTILQDLLHQANDATRGHAQAPQDLSPAKIQQIVDLEMGVTTAQWRDNNAGNLDAQQANGGPNALSRQDFFLGINDPVGLNPSGAAFNPAVFTLFDGWGRLHSSHDDPLADPRSAVYRGQQIFNTKTFTISGVAGLNGQTFPNGATVPASITGTCTVCHNSPNAGNHSVKAPLNIGISDPDKAPYLPVYVLRNLSTHEEVRTTDPGRAMISGKWADIGKFKGPVLRALAARPPYFHNGSAATLEQAVDFYDTRFNIGLTPQEKADLAAFLRAL